MASSILKGLVTNDGIERKSATATRIRNKINILLQKLATCLSINTNYS